MAPTLRPPLPCASLTALVDVGDFRIYAMVMPPVDEARTLVYGKLEDGGAPGAPPPPFVARSPAVVGSLRHVARFLNLKPHAVEAAAFGPSALRPSSAEADAVTAGGERSVEDPATLATRTLVVPPSLEVHAHQCANRRFYVMNTGRLAPADLPPPGAADAGAAAACLGLNQ